MKPRFFDAIPGKSLTTTRRRGAILLFSPGFNILESGVSPWVSRDLARLLAGQIAMEITAAHSRAAEPAALNKKPNIKRRKQS